MNTIHNVNGTAGSFFAQPARTGCSTTYHTAASFYYPNPSWGYEIQEICYINFYKPNNYGGTGYARLLLQYSAVNSSGATPYNTSAIHWNSNRVFGFDKHTGATSYSAVEADSCFLSGSGCSPSPNPLSAEGYYSFYIKH